MGSLRVLLIDVYRVSLDTSKDMVEYPLGLLYIATSLKRAFGEKVSVRIELYNDRSDSLEKVERLLKEFSPDVLGLRALTMGRIPFHQIATLAKKKYLIPLIVAGGPHATDSPEDVLENGSFDGAVLGEGEDTAVELVSCVLKHKPFDSVKGLALRDSRGEVVRSVRSPIAHLDAIPIPDHRLVDFRKMTSGFVDFSFRIDVPHANVFTSRGCPYHCIYCHHIFGKQFRAHSPARIMEEIKELYEAYGITHFQILDDIFNVDRNRALEFFSRVVRSGLPLVLSFPNGLRGDCVDKELIDAMWEAGVRYISYAVETGSPRIQDLIQKNLKLDRILEAIALTTARGIVTRGFFMLGFPTETKEEALMTIDYAKSSDLVLAMFFAVVYFPGTPLFRLAQRFYDMSHYKLGLEDDYVCTREGPYAFSRETLDELKLKAIREFYFSHKRIRMFFDMMPNFYSQQDIDASILVNIISGMMKEKDVENSDDAGRLHRYFIIADRFSKKSGFFV